MQIAEGRDVLLLDGDCGLCHRLALFMDPRLNEDADIAYREISSDEGQELISELNEWERRADTVYLFRDGRSFVRSSAAIRCLLYLKWYWRIWFPIMWLVPVPLRAIAYRIVANNRHRFFDSTEACTFRIDLLMVF